ncbi:response regulator [Paenibacillus thalictri]|uniref:response regulator n=1 Tax=Paenibacillus thalictri TaxID=2527873 RepID=UPI001F0E3246|nr:response regulator [Paenibacillus thalictri]
MIRVMLIDDEEDALDLLEILLGNIGNVEVVGRYLNPIQAVEAISQARVDAVFLDNQMPGMIGMETARKIRQMMPQMQIVFTTAYAEYAVEAFEIQSTDYLLKPLTVDRLQNAVARIKQTLSDSVFRTGMNVNIAPIVQCLGGFHILLPNADNKVLSWITKKEKELCAFLIHHDGKPASTASIIESLWPEYDLYKAKTYLYTCLSYLRRTLAENNVPISIHKADQGFVAVSEDELKVDVSEFEQLLSDTISEKETDIRLYDKINSIYKGEYMEACDYRWASPRQAEIKTAYIRALRNGYAHFRSQGNMALAENSLQRLLTLAPDSEMDGRELIKLYLESGNRNEALRICLQLEKDVRFHLGPSWKKRRCG